MYIIRETVKIKVSLSKYTCTCTVYMQINMYSHVSTCKNVYTNVHVQCMIMCDKQSNCMWQDGR